jgi:phosphoadenosine phosphosulfate reductase
VGAIDIRLLGADLAEPQAILSDAISREFAGRIAVVSSFGAESAVLLSMVAEIDPATPVLFLETGQHFPETLSYRRRLAERLRLTDVRDVSASEAEIAGNDPFGELYRFDTDACCALRKVRPLERALVPFDAWVTGRKRYQGGGRARLPVRETVDGRVKINPLAAWSAERIAQEMTRRGLPRHPLSLVGYPSIGCAACTRAVAAGQDPRSGRWVGTAKTECGIHRPTP